MLTVDFNVWSFIFLVLVLQFSFVLSRHSSRDSKEAELICASVIFRHGARNGGISYKNDPWKSESDRQGGYMQLTNEGKQQQYELGKYLRRRFQSILDREKGKNLNDILHVRSSDDDRTLMSASVNLAGMFPPEGDQIWNSDLLWQPIPIHTLPREQDYIVAFGRKCPRFDFELHEYQNSTYLKAMRKEHHSMFRYLASHSGEKVKNVMDVWRLYDTLKIQQSRNMELPEWAKAVLVPGGEMEILTSLGIRLGSDTPSVTRLRIGFMLREILKHFKDKIKSKLNPDRSIWMYSGHDTAIASFLHGLRLANPGIPPFCATIFMELYKTKEDFSIKISYKNSTGDPTPLHIPSCGVMCPIKKFTHIYKAIIPTGSFEDECRMDDVKSDEISGITVEMGYNSMFFIVLVVGLSMNILFLVMITMRLFYRTKAVNTGIATPSIFDGRNSQYAEFMRKSMSK